MFKLNKTITLAVLTANILFAQELNEIEVYASNVVDNNGSAEITGGVVIEYKGDLLTAKSAIYDKANQKLTLKDSVTVIGKSGKRINAKELIVNLDNDHLTFKDFFQLDKDDIWITSTNAKKEEDIYNFKNALFSSCNVDNPDWMVGFDKAVYDTKTKMLKLSDAKIYIKDIPLFYFPYLPLYLGKERKTGLLRPVWGNMNDEGYMLELPYFWAINLSQDLEIDPQIRTKRGYGLYLTYRFYHKKDAYGVIKAGYFKDKQSYTNRYNLRYTKHYGAEIKYTNNSPIDSLAKGDYENKLYINGIYLSDSDYVGLQNGNRIGHHKLGSYYESRLNYFIRNNYFYSGIGFRYFKSDNSINNRNTIQILPNLHFHLPYSNLFLNNLSYSADLAITNYTRVEGSKALRVKLKAPIEMHFSLFNNYLNLNLSEELEATGYDFYNVPIEQKKYSSIVANHKIELSTELSKPYSSGVHTAMYSLSLTKSNLISDKWMKYKDIPQDLKTDFIDDIPFDTKLTFRTHQYWQSYKNGINIDYILEAHYYPKEHKVRDMTQEIGINYKKWSFYSQFGYNFLHKTTTGFYNKIGYRGKTYGLFFSYLWKKDYLSLETVSKDLGVSGYYNYSDKIRFRASASYNVKDSYLKTWSIGTNINRNCWSIDLSLGESIRPVIRSNGSRGSISNKYIAIQVTVLPFGFGYNTAFAK